MLYDAGKKFLSVPVLEDDSALVVRVLPTAIATSFPTFFREYAPVTLRLWPVSVS